MRKENNSAGHDGLRACGTRRRQDRQHLRGAHAGVGAGDALAARPLDDAGMNLAHALLANRRERPTERAETRDGCLVEAREASIDEARSDFALELPKLYSNELL